MAEAPVFRPPEVYRRKPGTKLGIAFNADYDRHKYAQCEYIGCRTLLRCKEVRAKEMLAKNNGICEVHTPFHYALKERAENERKRMAMEGESIKKQPFEKLYRYKKDTWEESAELCKKPDWLVDSDDVIYYDSPDADEFDPLRNAGKWTTKELLRRRLEMVNKLLERHKLQREMLQEKTRRYARDVKNISDAPIELPEDPVLLSTLKSVLAANKGFGKEQQELIELREEFFRRRERTLPKCIYVGKGTSVPIEDIKDEEELDRERVADVLEKMANSGKSADDTAKEDKKNSEETVASKETAEKQTVSQKVEEKADEGNEGAKMEESEKEEKKTSEEARDAEDKKEEGKEETKEGVGTESESVLKEEDVKEETPVTPTPRKHFRPPPSEFPPDKKPPEYVRRGTPEPPVQCTNTALPNSDYCSLHVVENQYQHLFKRCSVCPEVALDFEESVAPVCPNHRYAQLEEIVDPVTQKKVQRLRAPKYIRAKLPEYARYEGDEPITVKTFIIDEEEEEIEPSLWKHPLIEKRNLAHQRRGQAYLDQMPKGSNYKGMPASLSSSAATSGLTSGTNPISISTPAQSRRRVQPQADSCARCRPFCREELNKSKSKAHHAVFNTSSLMPSAPGQARLRAVASNPRQTTTASSGGRAPLLAPAGSGVTNNKPAAGLLQPKPLIIQRFQSASGSPSTPLQAIFRRNQQYLHPATKSPSSAEGTSSSTAASSSSTPAATPTTTATPSTVPRPVTVARSDKLYDDVKAAEGKQSDEPNPTPADVHSVHSDHDFGLSVKPRHQARVSGLFRGISTRGTARFTPYSVRGPDSVRKPATVTIPPPGFTSSSQLAARRSSGEPKVQMASGRTMFAQQRMPPGAALPAIRSRQYHLGSPMDRLNETPVQIPLTREPEQSTSSKSSLPEDKAKSAPSPSLPPPPAPPVLTCMKPVKLESSSVKLPLDPPVLEKVDGAGALDVLAQMALTTTVEPPVPPPAAAASAPAAAASKTDSAQDEDEDSYDEEL